jgi:hypothetical protein
MARISGIEPSDTHEEVQRSLASQEKKWGAPFGNHLIYARRPTIHHGAREMWKGIAQSKLIDGKLQSMLNRRVALINGCEF